MRSRRRTGPTITSLVAASTLVTLACGEQATPAGAGSAWHTAAAEVDEVRPGPDDRSLIVRVAVLPVVGSTGDCAVTTAHDVTGEDGLLRVGVTYDSPHPDRDPAFPGCRTAPRDVVVPLDGPVAGRHVVTQTPFGRWVPDGEGAYRRCELPACDPATGEQPAPATCDDATLADAVRAGDVPRRVGIDTRRCELPWAVVDVDIGAGACPATGDATNPCAGEDVMRTYWRTAGHTWEQIATTRGAGCGDVGDREPAFPLELCRDLPAPPAATDRD